MCSTLSPRARHGTDPQMSIVEICSIALMSSFSKGSHSPPAHPQPCPATKDVPWPHLPNKPLPLKSSFQGLFLRNSLYDRTYVTGCFWGKSCQVGRNKVLGKDMNQVLKPFFPLNSPKQSHHVLGAHCP